MVPKILRLPAVIDKTGLSRATIYLKISKKTFPSPISLGERSVGWLESEVEAWIQRQIDNSRSA
jgi:prophage regulatory protein